MSRISAVCSFFIFSVISTAAPSLALAETVTMSFRLVTQEVAGNSFEPAADPGRRFGVGKNVGTAIFEDGRIAHKTYTYLDNGENSSIDTGYSTYVFQHGTSWT